jgi:predicted CoA-binding protein
MSHTRPTDDQLAEIYRSVKTVAVVGASTNEAKPAHGIPAYLQSQGFRIIPVNPAADEIFGQPTVASLSDITEPVDVVDVFRRPELTPAIAAEAISIGARVLWLQAGIKSEDAANIAIEGGLAVVMDTCMGAKHQQLVKAGLL